jgi:hypothetical protein
MGKLTGVRFTGGYKLAWPHEVGEACLVLFQQ